MKAIRSVTEINQEDAKALLLAASEQGFDSVIVFGFRHRDHTFSITSSKIHQRFELLGALREAEHHVINNGVRQL